MIIDICFLQGDIVEFDELQMWDGWMCIEIGKIHSALSSKPVKMRLSLWLINKHQNVKYKGVEVYLQHSLLWQPMEMSFLKCVHHYDKDLL